VFLDILCAQYLNTTNHKFLVVKMSGIFDRLKSGAGDVAHKAEKMARIRRLEGDISEIKKQVDEEYHKIGEMTYKSKVKEEADNPKLATMIPKITNLLQQIGFIEAEIKEVEAED